MQASRRLWTGGGGGLRNASFKGLWVGAGLRNASSFDRSLHLLYVFVLKDYYIECL